ncbi:ABC transporter substrate-binding protein [Cellulomonas endophytica]|uniref:ABC transporter substrate-binding protein n=1 Tax=Cellulomonas endophytica TaxID=2494735 RepID=UPI001F0BB0A0|nr:ABC transporter substrate-binding protein [Cellulomonas endophytica]
MRTNSRTWAVVAGTASLALGLAACGSGDAGDGDSSGGTAEGGDVTLTVATFNEFGYDELLEEYESLNPNVTIEHKRAATSDEARDNLNTRLAAGSGLSDIEAVEMDWLPELRQYADRFVDLEDPEVEGRWFDWKEAPARSEDGTLFAYGTDTGPEAVCYRSDLFAKAGLPTDRAEVATLLEGDWDRYFEVGKQFHDATGIPWYDSAAATYQGMVNQLESAYEDPETGEPIPLEENEQVKELFETVLTASTTDDLSAHFQQWQPDWREAFQSDGFATMLCPGWMLGIIAGNAEGVEGWDVADVFPGGGGNWGGSYLTVPEQGENIEAAKALAKWLTAPEQQVKAFLSKGTFPSQVDAQDDEELLASTHEFFNDAPWGEILVNRAAAIDVTPFKGAAWFPIHQTIVDGMTRVDVARTDDIDSSWEKSLQAYSELGLS